jgi:aldehyde dehydrogenase (NAD+)
MIKYQQFYINGQWVNSISNETLDVINPATENVIANIAIGSEEDVENAVKAANNAFNSYSFSSLEERIVLLQRIVSTMKERSDDLADAMTKEMGAPYLFSREEQVASGIDHCEVMIETLKNFSFTQQRGNAQVHLEPIGVCGLITPWNWPLNQIACKVFPALAAGCTMVLKPSEIAPLSALIFAEIMDASGVPKGVFNLINGTGEGVGNALSTHKDVQMMSITGSTRAGIAVAKASADTVKRVHQELGGNCPNLILKDAPLSSAIENGLRSVFSNSGQTCDSPARMLIPAILMAQAIVIAKNVCAQIRVGDPEDKHTEVGPLVSAEHFTKVQALIQSAIEEGATVVAGGAGKPAHLSTGYFCQPTVLVAKPNSAIVKQEIFGPVVVMVPYEDEHQAITMANDTEYGLAGYVQSADQRNAQKIAKQLRCGTVQINYPEYNSRVPFGGYKQSGNGREYADFGLMDFLEYKSIIG